MLFMVMHKMTPELEKGLPPSPDVIQKMGKLVGEAREKGIFYDGAGLHRSSERVRLVCRDGQCTKTEGPLRGSNELISSFVILRVPTMDDAIAWGTRLADVVGGEVEIDVGPVVEPWDLGLMPKPKNPPLRVMAMTKANAASESGAPSAATAKKMEALVASMKQAGVFLAAESLEPSSRGARLRTASGKRTWTDGPFAESKEFISGFTIIRVDSIKEAMTWTEAYADILGDIEVDVRLVST